MTIKTPEEIAREAEVNARPYELGRSDIVAAIRYDRSQYRARDARLRSLLRQVRDEKGDWRAAVEFALQEVTE